MVSFNLNTTGKEVVETVAERLSGKKSHSPEPNSLLNISLTKTPVLITGPSANSIGGETAISLAYGNPAHILLARRTESKALPVIQKIKELNPGIRTKFIHIDLASQKSIRKVAEEINSTAYKIDYPINNAGIIAVPTYQTTKDGIELQFGSNYIGHFLLTKLLMPRILAAGKGVRIANVGSTGYELGGVRFEDWNFEDGKVYSQWLAYAQSKTGTLLFSAGLAKRLKSRGSNVLLFNLEVLVAGHITADMWGDAIQWQAIAFEGKKTELEAPKSLQEGCATTLVAILDPSIEESSGSFLMNCVLHDIPEDYAKGKENIDKLWALSEKLIGEIFDL